MSADDTRTLARRYVEFFNSDALEAVRDVVAVDYVLHGAAGAALDVRGVDGFKRRVAGLRAAFPDYRATVDAVIVEGDTAAVRYSAQGTHEGPFRSLTPTGKQIAYSGMFFLRIAGNRVAEEWLCWDALGVMQQLGALQSSSAPPPGRS
jgi:steroid delta-isomerase-like uncharacterized protein